MANGSFGGMQPRSALAQEMGSLEDPGEGRGVREISLALVPSGLYRLKTETQLGYQPPRLLGTYGTTESSGATAWPIRSPVQLFV